MPLAEAKLARLPLWARQEIDRLQRDLAAAYARLTEGGSAACDTFAEPYSSAPRPLGEGAHIEFRLDEDTHIHCYVERNWKGDSYLQVRANTATLAITPRASNACELRAVSA